jgi:hypothetical protein
VSRSGSRAPMPDVCANIAGAGATMQQGLAGVLELRAADPQQRRMLESYTAELVRSQTTGTSHVCHDPPPAMSASVVHETHLVR